MTTLDLAVLELLEAEPNLEKAQIENRIRHPATGQIVDRLAEAGQIEPCCDTWTAPIFWCVAK